MPALVYSEPPLHLRVLRDMASHETKMIVVDDPDAYGEMQAFVQRFMASPRPRINYYNHPRPMFDALKIENEIEEGLGRKVWLKSGGYLIFDQGEALTAIDVNTGRYTGGRGRNLEDTILKTNLEAVREIVHQLRFRNLGGLIILDLIDMESAGNREKVYRALSEALREDKAKVNILKISELGLVEMTRKRTRESLEQQLCKPCTTCEGKGYLQSAQTISNRIFRDLPKAATYLHGATLRIQAHESVTQILLGVGVEGLEKIRARIGREIIVEAMPAYHPEQYQIVSEGPRVELLAPPEVDLRFDDAPEAIALSEDDAKADELDAEPEARASRSKTWTTSRGGARRGARGRGSRADSRSPRRLSARADGGLRGGRRAGGPRHVRDLGRLRHGRRHDADGPVRGDGCRCRSRWCCTE